MEETKVVCPVCGAEIEIAQHEHVVSNAVVIGEDSGAGTIVLPLKKKHLTADEKIAKLKAAGVAGDFFSIKSGDNEFVGKMDGGSICTIDEDDYVYKKILGDGIIGNNRLFRRFVMSQMLGLLDNDGWWRGANFTSRLQRRGGAYMWKMMYNELKSQAALYKNNDTENLWPRQMFFSRELVVHMMRRYYNKLHDDVCHLEVHKCKGKPYVRISKIGNVFSSELESKVFGPLKRAECDAMMSKNPQELFDAYKKFYSHMARVYYRDKHYKGWIDAYKAVGAYFTMKNMIMFHGCNINGCNDTESSLNELDYCLKKRVDSGWEMLGMLKDFIRYNNFDIKKKRAEWKKAYMNKQ